MHVSTLSTRCCIVGGGPAGLMLGFLLARAGLRSGTVPVEKRARVQKRRLRAAAPSRTVRVPRCSVQRARS